VTLAWWYRLFFRHLRAVSTTTVAVAILTLTSFFSSGLPLPRQGLPWYTLARDVIDIAGLAFLLVAAAFAALFLIAAHLIAPPGAVTLDQLLLLPPPPSRHPYRFRYRIPTHPKELWAVVTIADNEFGAVARHPTLCGPKRYELYLKWWTHQPASFMILDRFDQQVGYWTPFAVTVILPLTVAGADLIECKQMRLTDLDKNHIDTSTSSTVLVEAWIMRKRNPLVALRNPTIRPDQEEYAKALLFVHLGRFHSGDSSLPAVIYTDTSTPRMKRVAAELGFSGNFMSLDGSPFQRLSLPDATGSERARYIHAILYDHVRLAREWPLVRN
jgi:hypothetical protein